MTAREARVVTFGEMLLRLSPADGSRLFESSNMHASFGGAEANVAVALAHLGIGCDYVTRLPDNLVGDAALATLSGEGVGVGGVVRGPGRMGLYFVEPGADVGNARVVYDRSPSAFSAIAPAMLSWPATFAGAAWFHVTCITAALGPGPLETLAAAIADARRSDVPVSVDLNWRPSLWRDRDPVAVVEPLLRGIDLLIANPHSLRAMLGEDAADDLFDDPVALEALAYRIAGRFECRRVALTRRQVPHPGIHRWSASLVDRATKSFVMSAAWQVAVIDRIGSGDAFAAALIAALVRGKTAPDAVEFAVAAGALKLRVAGDFNRASIADVDALLASSARSGTSTRQLTA